ncbi:MAG: ATP-dependent Clp protease adapter ClpS [Candidatus Aminicenantes bacterium]|nr:ATP-dependent Clp protease adapter ClpS [Candidatus Aminicenantes bacterium]
MSSEGSTPGPEVASPQARIQQDVRPPRMYRVVLHNDDYTSMDFVVDVLISVFHKPAAEATRIMLDVHRQGHGVCGTYIPDVARTKAGEVRRRARKQQFPLRCTCEPA